MSLWRYFKLKLHSGGKELESYPSGVTPGEKDMLTAIRELSRVLMDNNTDAMEIYQALGNLYRSRGDVERAVQIRESLLNRPELPQNLKGRTYFELGQDYRRAGLLDRAYKAYIKARELGMPSSLINGELALLYAGIGNWEKACEYFRALGNQVAEAHFMVRQGTEMLHQDCRETKRARRLFEKALKICPVSLEAWFALISEYSLAENWNMAAKTLAKALERIPSEKSFILFEEILLLKPRSGEMEDNLPPAENEALDSFHIRLTDAFIPILENRPPEVFPNFYGSKLLQRSGRLDEARQWLDKALVMQPEFWYGRLDHLRLIRGQHDIPPLLDLDIDFFITQSDGVKNFVCSACGLKRAQVFYCCQRCNSWHSAAYKFTLRD
jgi:tetratricopeptide (TPR) repeat protein